MGPRSRLIYSLKLTNLRSEFKCDAIPVLRHFSYSLMLLILVTTSLINTTVLKNYICSYICDLLQVEKLQ